MKSDLHGDVLVNLFLKGPLMGSLLSSLVVLLARSDMHLALPYVNWHKSVPFKNKTLLQYDAVNDRQLVFQPLKGNCSRYR